MRGCRRTPSAIGARRDPRASTPALVAALAEATRAGDAVPHRVRSPKRAARRSRRSLGRGPVEPGRTRCASATAPSESRAADTDRFARLRRRLRGPGERAREGRRAAGRAPSEPGRDRPGVDPDHASTAAQARIDFGADLGGDARRRSRRACPSSRRPARRRLNAHRRRRLAARRRRASSAGDERRAARRAPARLAARERDAPRVGPRPRRRRRRRPLRLRRSRTQASSGRRKARLIAASRPAPVSIISLTARQLRDPAQALP